MLDWFTETGFAYLLGVAVVPLIGLVLLYRGLWGDRSKGRVRWPSGATRVESVARARDDAADE
jgi:hypothetical protein